jgi:hypothetical protein
MWFKTIIASVLISGSVLTVQETQVLELADKALLKTEAIQKLTDSQHLQAATQMFLLAEGRLPTSEQELYEKHYLEPKDVPQELTQDN